MTKRFDDELSELSVDGLVESHSANIYSGFNTCKRAAGIDGGMVATNRVMLLCSAAVFRKKKKGGHTSRIFQQANVPWPIFQPLRHRRATVTEHWSQSPHLAGLLVMATRVVLSL